MAKHLLASPAALALQIEVVGSDLDGQQYMERAHTLSITRDGATILLAKKLAPESELLVRNLQTDVEAFARVVGHIREEVSGHVYGVALIDPSVDLWGIQLSSTESEDRTILECCRCHMVRAIALTEIEMEVFESKRALTLHCECSNSSTIWKQTTRDVSAEPQRTSPRKIPRPEAVAPLSREKRKHKRTAVKTAACIRYAGKEDIVECEDVSRGGFRFKSRKEYPKGIQIEAAVLYVRSNINIFLPGQIVYHQKLSAGSHRHGVCYSKMRVKSDPDP
jgi:hypothetical protein